MPEVKDTPEVEETSTAVATVTSLSPEELAVVQAQQDEFGDESLSVPILKVAQALTREVQEGEAEAGEFINTLTGESLGNEIDFIISYYQQGRAAADRDSGRYYVAFGDEIPEAWGDFLGEDWVGTRFDEHPDAEEQYKKRVNNKEIEWGKGPLISTTHNYTGFVIVPAIEGTDDEDELQPVRLSLSRAQMKAVRKINSLYRMTMRNRPYWDKVFNLTTTRESFSSGSAYIVKPSIGRDTTPDERSEGGQLAVAVAAGRVEETDRKADTPVEPDAKGGLDV